MNTYGNRDILQNDEIYRIGKFRVIRVEEIVENPPLFLGEYHLAEEDRTNCPITIPRYIVRNIDYPDIDLSIHFSLSYAIKNAEYRYRCIKNNI